MRNTTMKRIRIAKAEDVPSNGGIPLDLDDGCRIAVFCHQDRYYALDETCPHRGGPLHSGPVKDGVVSCPWHFWQFDLQTGVSPVNPLSKVRAYSVEQEDGELFLVIDDTRSSGAG